MQRLFQTSVLAFSLYASASMADGIPEGFVKTSDALPEILCEARYHGLDNFVGEQIDGYEQGECVVSSEAAAALQKISAELSEFGLVLKIFDGYRPQQAVDHFVRWAEDLDDRKMKQKYYPGVEKKHLFRDGYIAEKSGHSRGSSVDVTIASESGEELDMGSGWDFFDPRSWPSSREVNPAQRANRMLLQQLMVRHGFKPLKEEWWHFTLKDEPYPDTYFNFAIR